MSVYVGIDVHRKRPRWRSDIYARPHPETVFIIYQGEPPAT